MFIQWMGGRRVRVWYRGVGGGGRIILGMQGAVVGIQAKLLGRRGLFGNPRGWRTERTTGHSESRL